jgi:hypothetical protein
MALRARVGRHTKLGGRHCQNWAEDQQTIIDLLNRIPVADGGTGGKLNGRIIVGMSSDALYRAISQFEDKHFRGQRSGFVDPGGAMLKRMEELAARATNAPTATQPAAKPKPLDVLRRNVLNATAVTGKWTAGELVEFEPLVTMVVKHIDSLKSQGFDNIPYAELWGRAHVIDMGAADAPVTSESRLGIYNIKGRLQLGYDDAKGRFIKPDLPEMSYGRPLPIKPRVVIATTFLGAMLLFQDGTCFRLGTKRIRRLDYIMDLARKGIFAD